jgi:hypothetical protein
MKTNKKLHKFKPEISEMEYCDFSSNEESRLSLIANLLLQSDSGLEATQLHEIGFQIRRFLEIKAVLDHLIWNREIPESLLSAERLKLEVKVMKNNILARLN